MKLLKFIISASFILSALAGCKEVLDSDSQLPNDVWRGKVKNIYYLSSISYRDRDPLYIPPNQAYIEINSETSVKGRIACHDYYSSVLIDAKGTIIFTDLTWLGPTKCPTFDIDFKFPADAELPFTFEGRSFYISAPDLTWTAHFVQSANLE